MPEGEEVVSAAEVVGPPCGIGRMRLSAPTRPERDAELPRFLSNVHVSAHYAAKSTALLGL